MVSCRKRFDIARAYPIQGASMAERLPFLLIFYPVFLISLSCHEAAHAWMSNRFGDPTARLLGRISLNPLPHMDIIGTVFLPIFGILTGAPVIGCGKPVPVNPYNLRDPRKDELFISVMGPTSNIVLALVFAGLGRLVAHYFNNMPPESIMAFPTEALGIAFTACYMGVRLNLALAIFNMIPLYPLDGGGVIRGLLPDNMVMAYDRIARQGMFLILILFVSGLLKFIFIPVQIVSRVLLPM